MYGASEIGARLALGSAYGFRPHTTGVVPLVGVVGALLCPITTCGNSKKNQHSAIAALQVLVIEIPNASIEFCSGDSRDFIDH